MDEPQSDEVELEKVVVKEVRSLALTAPFAVRFLLCVRRRVSPQGYRHDGFIYAEVRNPS